MLKLVKRKDICRMLGISPSKVNFYTTQELFPLEGRTRGGYGLYDSDLIRSRFARISELKSERLTIAEIRERILEEEKERGQFLELKFEN
ncbi:MAG: MerR family transcriptional regulator [bacterium]|nr:MerR family transcriptional regulator [bacterium]MDT8364918.1 MerR family transcriptional regulator [bacterium]